MNFNLFTLFYVMLKSDAYIFNIFLIVVVDLLEYCFLVSHPLQKFILFLLEVFKLLLVSGLNPCFLMSTFLGRIFQFVEFVLLLHILFDHLRERVTIPGVPVSFDKKLACDLVVSDDL